MHTLSKPTTLIFLIVIALAGSLNSPSIRALQVEMDGATSAALDAAIGGEHRSEANKARDKYRRPKETLAFFGFRSDMTVVEIWPGGGWYTEILAPALQESGKLYAAQYSVNPSFGYQRRYFGAFLTKLGANNKIFKDIEITHLDFPYEMAIAPAGSADMVLTFRNAHNWVSPGYGAKASSLSFKVMFDVLKPGGVLGVVDHRWPDPKTEDPNAEDGYISEERIVELAKAAGFELAARSDMNRNPADDHEHPQGVWTLPPSLALGDKDREQYIKIGESDRMTLKFVKPAK
ncbi:MAG: class I SAM-dependent methyltransferase [Gammaproteobacteria bacterium]|nr:class I SAM-dependent methyltransferase [Gammaproteobacteria bacterium]